MIQKNLGKKVLTEEELQNHIKKENGRFPFVVDLADFSGFLRDNVPLRFNVYGDDFAWVKHEKLPSRLMFGDTNWNCAGWLTE